MTKAPESNKKVDKSKPVKKCLILDEKEFCFSFNYIKITAAIRRSFYKDIFLILACIG